MKRLPIQNNKISTSIHFDEENRGKKVDLKISSDSITIKNQLPTHQKHSTT